MKNIIFLSLIFLSTKFLAQDDMKPIGNVTVTVEGINGNTIGKSKLTKLTKLELSGADAKKYKIISYNLAYIGAKGVTEAGMEGETITNEELEFFEILEKDCRISFKEVVVRNTETNKLFKVGTLVLNVKTKE